MQALLSFEGVKIPYMSLTPASSACFQSQSYTRSHVSSLWRFAHLALQIICCLAAGKAWQTPLGRYAPQQAHDAAPGGAAWAAVLQLPLEGPLSEGGGIQFVVKRALGAQPEWLSGPDNKDFFISLDQVGLLGNIMDGSTVLQAVSATA